MSSILRVASLFSGCGGLDFAFHDNDHYQIVYANDSDIDCCQTYLDNYGFEPIHQDIKAIRTIPDCDVLLGGFPCQGFSIANIHRSTTDTRNDLYLELVRLLNLKHPKYFIFENVKGLLSLGGYETKEDRKYKQGNVFKMIVRDLSDCGYIVHTNLFKLNQYGIPQKRQRVIFFGIRCDIAENSRVINWPLPFTTPQRTLRDAIGDLPLEYDEKIQHIGTQHKVKITNYMGNRQLDWDDAAPTITGRGGGTGGPVINVHPSGERRMTVREYARIQTFPDTFMFHGSVSSMYRQIGNAVPPAFSVILSNFLCDIVTQYET